MFKIFLSLIVGLALGVGFYTFIYSKGYSYLSNNPSVCTNCHIMQTEYDGWIKSSHHHVAVCNDCHMPDNFFGKYWTKALNGFWHSFYFTTGSFKEPIQITKRNFKIAENNCRRCHQDVVDAMDGSHGQDKKLSCIRCHGSVGHP
ncbi:MAG: cytochrome c nitrite reductase small subunit [Deltaproteobacteria bacterium]|nr:cytochrome c nitrite reductase small subunit [Deltaproteobacteria bacterium]